MALFINILLLFVINCFYQCEEDRMESFLKTVGSGLKVV